jgi:hypothetical protein
MQFERTVELAKATPSRLLCEAWGVPPQTIEGRDYTEAPMSIREAGALAEIHGLKLLDVLAV